MDKNYLIWLKRAVSNLKIAGIKKEDDIYYEDLCYEAQQIAVKNCINLHKVSIGESGFIYIKPVYKKIYVKFLCAGRGWWKNRPGSPAEGRRRKKLRGIAGLEPGGDFPLLY